MKHTNGKTTHVTGSIRRLCCVLHMYRVSEHCSNL